MRRILTTVGVGALLCAGGFVRADDTPKEGDAEQRGSIAAPETKQVVHFPLKFGMETVNGLSNVPGYRHYSDGMWAGSGVAYPSVGYLRWDNGSGQAGKVSIGVGSLYSGSGSAVEQPVEAWWQVPAGKSNLTVGKFWVPFAAQEWVYETKPGAMLQWEERGFGLALAANYNVHTHGMNGYLRAGKSLGKDAAVGISFGAGRGLSFDSIHDHAWGLDATFLWKGFRFTGEYVGMTRHASEAFGSTFGRVQYENLGPWRPFVALYSWNDRSGEFERFRSTVYGMGYQVTPMLSLETAIAPTSNRRINWLQLHWAWER